MPRNDSGLTVPRSLCQRSIKDVFSSSFVCHYSQISLEMKFIICFFLNGSIERACNKDIVCEGIHIPKGTLVSVSTYALHYSEEYYVDAETFNPDR